MDDYAGVEQVVESPTYMADIRYFFRPEDVEHMAWKGEGMDLGTYEGVKRNAIAINAHTTPPNAHMPPDAAGKWSSERSQTFRNWILSGYPVGSASSKGTERRQIKAAPPTHLRKNVATLSDGEFEKLKTAFTGLMERDPSQADSYFALAGIHGLPQRWCLHHEDRYNPWHRVYLRAFEDALRSVPGCEEVTLPYWDIRTELPDRLQHPPFDRYVLPQDPGANATPPPATSFFPYTTSRHPSATITQNLIDYGVFEDIDTSMKQSLWGASDVNGYQDFSIQAHDGGHGSIGRTMSNQSVAAYDPIFWFFHCNLDRLWLSWQHCVGATTLVDFKSTLSSGSDWLAAPFNVLPPFETSADKTIEFGMSYDRLELGSYEEATLENKVGSLDAARTFTIKGSSPCLCGSRTSIG